MNNRHDAECELGQERGRTCWCTVRKNAAEWIARVDSDGVRVRAELRDRLDRCTDADQGAAFGWLADNHPDLVREALDETGAPS